jgi:hypothetical protein
LPDFSWYNRPKRGKIYQITIKYTKWPLNVRNGGKYIGPNGHKIYQLLPSQDPPKFTQIGIWKYAIWQPCFRLFEHTYIHTYVLPISNLNYMYIDYITTYTNICTLIISILCFKYFKCMMRTCIIMSPPYHYKDHLILSLSLST